MGQEGAPELLVVEAGTDVDEAVKSGVLADLRPLLSGLTAPGLFAPALKVWVAAASVSILPASTSLWGLFANPTVLQNNGLKPPKDWKEFEAAAVSLKANGVTPLALGASFGFPALAWVSVLDLRFNGEAAHRDLLEGRRSFADPSLLLVWNTLADWRSRGWFDAGASTKNWPESLADVSAGRAAFVLLGSFGLSRITDKQTLEFLPLPSDRTVGSRSELGSVVGFAVSAQARNPKVALALADAYILAGSPGQLEEGYRSPALPRTGVAGSVGEQDQWLAHAVAVFPLLDRALPAAAAKRADLLIQQFFTEGSTLTATDLARAFQTLES